jgi:hypothetical protein
MSSCIIYHDSGEWITHNANIIARKMRDLYCHEGGEVTYVLW